MVHGFFLLEKLWHPLRLRNTILKCWRGLRAPWSICTCKSSWQLLVRKQLPEKCSKGQSGDVSTLPMMQMEVTQTGYTGQGKLASEVCCQPLVLAAGWGQCPCLCQLGNGEQQMLFCIPCSGKILAGEETHEKMEVYL